MRTVTKFTSRSSLLLFRAGGNVGLEVGHPARLLKHRPAAHAYHLPAGLARHPTGLQPVLLARPFGNDSALR